MSKTLVWIVGSSGLLGSHLRRTIDRYAPRAQIWEAAPQFSWTEPARLADELSRAAAQFAGAVRERADAWAILWCAGIGAISSPATALGPESWAWNRSLDLVGSHLAGPYSDLPGAIFLASSAGGIYGGNFGEILSEHTPPRPVSEYGAHKFRMEETLRNWAEAFPNVSFLIGRISSLYGPGQDLRKAQGVISHLSRCLIYRRAVNIYVSLDTRRDYLFADDCAHRIAASFGRLLGERPQGIIKIFASEELTSLARIVGVFFRMYKHHPLIVSQQRRGTQPNSLKLRSEVWRDFQGARRTDLATGIHLVHEHQLALYRYGLLPPPS
jgi:UDP-glucose 4-epimerase